MNPSTSPPIPLVSILVPMYNHERFVQACLASLLSAGWSRLELIVIDDGSSDHSLRIAQDWAARHGEHFEHIDISSQANQGITRTLNRLIAKARGEYLVVIASDDLLTHDSIAIRHAALQAHPEAMAVFADAIGIDDNGKQISASMLRERFGADVTALTRDGARALELILNWSVPGPVFMARRRAFDVVGGYDERYFIEDRDYYLRLLARHALTFVDQPVAAYRLHTNSISGTRARQVRIGNEIAKIETNLLPQFSGSARLALQLRIWANAATFRTATFWCKPWLAVRCIVARLGASGLLRLVRSGHINWREQ